MEEYTKEELEQALRAIDSTIRKCEKVQPKLKEGTSSHTLLVRRIKALNIASFLISRELEKHTPVFVFPAWQGAGDKAVYCGAIEMQKLTKQASDMQADVSLSDDLEIKNGIIGYDAIVRQLAEARKLLSPQRCSKILTLGGGCDAEILPVSYLNRQYDGDLAVVWFDAHGDLNTPTSSPSGLFHGMPLRCLQNEGDEKIRSLCFSHLQASQIIFAGCRDFDEPEQAYISENDMACIPPEELTSGHSLFGVLSKMAYRRVYVHIDLDVLDPMVFPSVMCPTHGGISVKKLIDTLHALHTQFDVVGIGIVEYVPGNGDCAKTLQHIISCCKKILA